MKVLITGGNGFIGSHLADKLVEMGENVTLLDLVFGENTSHLDCEKVVCDIRDYQKLKEVVNGKDVVFHFAALSRVVWGEERPIECVDINLIGTLNVLRAVINTGNRAFVFYASSREVYGNPVRIPVKEEDPKNPISVYGVSKLAAEMNIRNFFKHYGIRPIIFRFSNVFGSTRDQMDRVTPKFMLKAIRNEEITLYGGDQVLDFTFIDDVIDGIVKCYKRLVDGGNELIGEDFNFVSGRGTSVKELASLIVKICNSSSKIVREKAKLHDVKKFIGSYEKAFNFFGYEPKKSLEEGLKILKKRILERGNL